MDLAKKYVKASSGFVNAILRNVVRSRDTIDVENVETGSIVRNLSIRYSFPEYLVAQWLEEFGNDFTEGLLASLLERPDFSVRVNTLKTTREEVTEELSKAEIQADSGRFLPEALVLHNISYISNTEAFSKGKITVQDESSMLVTKILDPQPGEMILDVCAAPGGKTTISQAMENRGSSRHGYSRT